MGVVWLVVRVVYISNEENNLGWYLENATEKFLIGAKTVGVIKTQETVSKMERKRKRKSWTNEGLRKWKDKAMHGQFLNNMQETMDAEQTWSWFRSSDLKIQT